MNASDLAALLTTVLGAGGVVYGMSRWVGKVDENTKALNRLTGSFEKFTEKTADTLNDHEKRITVLEIKADG
jgi:hypothetical protein